MVRDVWEALERAKGDPPPWRHDVDDFVLAGRRLRRRRRLGVAAGSSALAVLAAGGLLVLPSHLDRWRDPGPPAVALPARAPGTGPAGTESAGTGSAGAGPVGSAGGTGPFPATSSPAGSSPVPSAARRAFSEAGYGYADAVLLARLWNEGLSPDGAEARAGDKLLSGLAMPTRPGETAATVSEDTATEAFFNHGHGYDDAVTLAKLWKMRTVGGNLAPVKAAAGRRLLAGQSLPGL